MSPIDGAHVDYVTSADGGLAVRSGDEETAAGVHPGGPAQQRPPRRHLHPHVAAYDAARRRCASAPPACHASYASTSVLSTVASTAVRSGSVPLSIASEV